MSSGEFEVNGYGDFIVEPPYSFHYGPGEYTIQIMFIKNFDGYVLADLDELSDTGISVVAT
jgi:hypothetical protein